MLTDQLKWEFVQNEGIFILIAIREKGTNLFFLFLLVN